jgi:transposase
VRLPDGGTRQVEPDWAGRLAGFTLLFEALIMMMCREMTFAAVSRLVGLSWHQVVAICKRYVELGLEQADFSEVKRLAADETSKAKGHDYITLVADADERRVLFVTEGKDADTIKAFAADFTAHGGDPKAVESISIDMSPAFIKGVTQHLPNARITFDKFHVVAHASTAVDKTRRIEQKTDPSLKGLRWKLLRDRASLAPEARADLDALIAQATTKRTARAWLYKEQLREILERKQINVVRDMLTQWATNVMRSKVEPMKEVAKMIRTHLDGIAAWTQTRQTNRFLEAINGLFQAAKRKARGYGNFSTIKTVVFLLAGKLDFSKINPHAA